MLTADIDELCSIIKFVSGADEVTQDNEDIEADRVSILVDVDPDERNYGGLLDECMEKCDEGPE
jgi:hypothetical protein